MAMFATKSTVPAMATVALGVLITLAGCSATAPDFNVGGCSSPDEIRRGDCHPTDVPPDEYYESGLACMVPALAVVVWPADVAEIGMLDPALVPDYDPDASELRWFCTTPDRTH